MKKKIIPVILATMLIAVGIGGFAIYNNLGQSPLRLHVIANSDSSYDQEIKLFVRDQILGMLADTMGEAVTKEEAMTELSAALPQIEECCNQVLAGIAPYGATAELEVAQFPTRRYENMVLPAGEYDALRIVLGEGKGKNWWCVLFPPLCLVDVTKEVKTTTVYSSEDSLPVSANTMQIKFKLKDLFAK